MSSFSGKLEDIERLISLNVRANKPLAYSSLLKLQEESGVDACSAQALTDGSLRLIPSIVADISVDDEEISALALKCLGFMIYHPAIVAAISVDVASAVLESLSKVITSTRMKSVCNLGVWCISMQQFDEPLLSAHFWSLLKAIVHALDNPFGSLSTTFEAIQALLKLASQLRKLMRDSSHVWAPPVYRRLLSNDKRERDMSERCLLKIRDTVVPPPLPLTKALASDMTQKLLIRMKEMLEQGMKVQTLQAWGWFIRLLGSYAMENRSLVNNMLKIPEATFADNDTQVQISSQVAWEGLVDALIPPSASTSEISVPKKDIGEIWSVKRLKSIKLIMTPIIGIISSKLDLYVHMSCLNTWFYLLHRLDVHINQTSVEKLVLEPVFDAVFKNGLESSRIWLWKMCLHLLERSVLTKLSGKEYTLDSPIDEQILCWTSKDGTSISSCCSWSQYPIKWLPWDLCRVSFYLDSLYKVVTEAQKAHSADENRIWVCDAALRIFRSVLKGIQVEVKSPSTNYDDISCCLKKVLDFVKETSSDGDEASRNRDELHNMSLRFLLAISEELESDVLGCPLYKVPLDIKSIDNQQLVNSSRHAQSLSVRPAAYMSMVSPMVNLIVLYFHVVLQLQSDVPPKKEIIYPEMQRYMVVLLSSDNSLENLTTINDLLHIYVQPSSLMIWTAVAEALRDAASVKDTTRVQMVTNNAGISTMCQFFSYPFFLYSFLQKKIVMAITNGSLEAHPIPLPQLLDLEHVLEVWRSFYSYISNKHFEHFTGKRLHEDLYTTVLACLQEIADLPECGTALDSTSANLSLDLLSLCGNAITCMLEQRLTGGSGWKNEGDCMVKFYQYLLKLAATFVELSGTMIRVDCSSLVDVTTRVLSSLKCWASCLHSKPDILVFVETLSRPLLPWLPDLGRRCKSISNQLQLLWVETLNCLLRSEPPVIYDSSFLKDHACLFEKTLNHLDPSIRDPTVSFWNSAYGEQTDSEYPPGLLHVLHRLSRTTRHGERPAMAPRPITISPEKYVVTSKHNISSKRVGLLELSTDKSERCEKSAPSLKRRMALTVHQKEVRRAQQGRERDCNGHGPGVRTYTSADFSQGNDDSQESQELPVPRITMEMPKRAC